MAIGANVQIGSGGPPKYPISAGMRPAKLISLTEAERKEMDFKGPVPTETGRMQPCFNFLFQFQDDTGELQALEVATTQKVHTKGMVSTLFKYLKGLHPAPDADFNNKDFVLKVLADLEARAQDKGVGCYLQLSIKESGWPKIDAVLPLPKKAPQAPAAAGKKEEVSFDDDDIPF